jgi:hypothetical protein
MDLPPHLFDKRIRRSALLARAAREDLLRRGPEEASARNPLADDRLVSSRATYLELGERGSTPIAASDGGPPAPPPADPLIEGIRAWVYALTLERVLWPDFVRLATAWHEASVKLDDPEPARLSPRTLLERVLAERSPGLRRAWADALARGSGRVADAAHILADRRAEAIRRLGVSDPDAIEIPCDPPDAVRAVADRLLKETEAMVSASASASASDADSESADASANKGATSWNGAIARSLARSATAGWPARISSRWIEELMRPTKLTEGLAIELGPLPSALGATSFARALESFGRAFAEASVPPSAPFVLACPPFDLRAARRAALFGGLLGDPVFGARVLGLGKVSARDQARVIARALLLSIRVAAARVLLRGALVLPLAQRGERFEEQTYRALGARIPSALAGVVPKLEPHDPTELAGIVLAARDRRDLIDRYDEDWFRSPHAARALREEQGVLPASTRVTAADLDASLTELIRALEAVLV